MELICDQESLWYLSVGESESPLTCELNYFIDSKSVETVSGGF